MKNCCLCKEGFVGYGHNAWPLCRGQCCDYCNIGKVLFARLLAMREQREHDDADETPVVSADESSAVDADETPVVGADETPAVEPDETPNNE